MASDIRAVVMVSADAPARAARREIDLDNIDSSWFELVICTDQGRRRGTKRTNAFCVPGRGTSVKVYLPRIDQPVTLESKSKRKILARGSETILVVEDDEMVRYLVRETLQREGYGVLAMRNPAGPVAVR